jgi:hypothetical protein
MSELAHDTDNDIARIICQNNVFETALRLIALQQV